MSAKVKLLLIDPMPENRNSLAELLAQHFEVHQMENGLKGIEAARLLKPELLLVDSHAPILNGYDLCSLLKQDQKTRSITVIILSLQDAKNGLEKSLRVGADDFIAKPYSYNDLLAKVQHNLKRKVEIKLEPLVAGDLLLDLGRREAKYQGTPIALTGTEYDLLKYLIGQSGAIISRDIIMKELWRNETELSSDRTIDVHIRSLRKKIPVLAKWIVSVYGVGYKFEVI